MIFSFPYAEMIIEIETPCVLKYCTVYSVYLISLLLISLNYLSMNNGFTLLLILSIVILFVIDFIFYPRVNHFALQNFKIIEKSLPGLKDE